MASVRCGSALVVAVCCAFYVWSSWTGTTPAICPDQLLTDHRSNLHMLLLPSFSHLSLLHILFNMSALISTSAPLEHRLGTAALIGVVLQLALVGNILYVLLAAIGAAVTGSAAVLRQCAAGLSGVIFGLLMVEIRLGRPGDSSHLTLGPIAVNRWLYPWLLLISIQILMPNVSFIGHLSGILAGLLYAFGFMNWFSLRRTWICWIEARLSAISAIPPYYVKCPDKGQVLAPACIDAVSSALRRRRISQSMYDRDQTDLPDPLV